MPKNVAMTDHRRAYSKKETAEQLGCSVEVVEDMIEDGRLRTVVVGQTTKVTRASIDDLLAS